MLWRGGDSVLQVCTCGAIFVFSGFCCACGFLFPLFRQNGMAVAVSLPPHCRVAAMRQPYRSLNGPRSTVSALGNETDASIKYSILAKISPKSTRSTRRADVRALESFLQFAILFAKATSFELKNVVFMCLIFNELNIAFP